MAKRLFFVHICFLPPPPKVVGGMVNNFLAPVQVWLSTNFVSHTLGHRRWGDQILEGQRSR